MKALNTSVVGSIVLFTSERHFAPSHPVSGFPGGSCNGYQLQTAICFVERER
jgi:hypothetical protein